MKTQYLSLEVLASVLGLPKSYLRQLTKQKQIPSLKVGGRMRFQESDVRDALSKMAQQTKSANDDSQQGHLAIEGSKEIYNVTTKLSKSKRQS